MQFTKERNFKKAGFSSRSHCIPSLRDSGVVLPHFSASQHHSNHQNIEKEPLSGCSPRPGVMLWAYMDYGWSSQWAHLSPLHKQEDWRLGGLTGEAWIQTQICLPKPKDLQSKAVNKSKNDEFWGDYRTTDWISTRVNMQLIIWEEILTLSQYLRNKDVCVGLQARHLVLISSL